MVAAGSACRRYCSAGKAWMISPREEVLMIRIRKRTPANNAIVDDKKVK
jgi:hypothetical protein